MLTKLMTCAAAIATLATAVPAAAQTAQQDRRFRDAQARFDREYQIFRQESDRYANARSRTSGYADPGYNQDAYYDPSRDYRQGAQYQERVLSSDDRVYAGTDGRYYCRRSDGTTGLIVGAAGGGILGRVIDGGRSSTVGTLLGAAAGALAGRAVERSQSEVRCR
jgi:hypothetical protein